MPKPLFLLLFLLISWPVIVQAQTDFRPGYVIPLSGDTLRGVVDYRGAQRNARQCRFRPSASDAIIEFQPAQLRGYGFAGDRVYQTEIVELSDSLRYESALITVADTLRRPTFLEVLVLGPASLLYLRDATNKDHYYLRMAQQPVQELLHTTRQVVENGVTYQRSSDEFRRTLAVATQQCLTLQPSLNTLRYGQSELMRFVRRYNECVGSTSVMPASAAHQNHVRLGIVAGAEVSRLTLNDNRFGQRINLKDQAAVAPVVGLALDLRLAGLNKTISARVETLYEQQRYFAQTSSGRTSQYRVELSSLRLPILIRYTYPRGTVRPFAQVGYGFSYLLRNKNEQRYTGVSSNPQSQDSEWKQLVAPRSLEQSLLGSIGLTTARPAGRNLTAEARFERSDGFSESVDFGSRINRFYLLLSYDLTR